MIDKDEEEYYKKKGEEPPAKWFRSGETYDFWEYVFLVIPFGISTIIADFLSINTIKVKILLGCTVLLSVFVFRVVLEKLYYKIKYKRYPHLNPDSQKSDKEIGSDDNNK